MQVKLHISWKHEILVKTFEFWRQNVQRKMVPEESLSRERGGEYKSRIRDKGFCTSREKRDTFYCNDVTESSLLFTCGEILMSTIWSCWMHLVQIESRFQLSITSSDEKSADFPRNFLAWPQSLIRGPQTQARGLWPHPQPVIVLISVCLCCK